MQRRPSCSNLEPARARPPELGQLGLALRIPGKELQLGSARIWVELLGFIICFWGKSFPTLMEKQWWKKTKVKNKNKAFHHSERIIFKCKSKIWHYNTKQWLGGIIHCLVLTHFILRWGIFYLITLCLRGGSSRTCLLESPHVLSTVTF